MRNIGKWLLAVILLLGLGVTVLNVKQTDFLEKVEASGKTQGEYVTGLIYEKLDDISESEFETDPLKLKDVADKIVSGEETPRKDGDNRLKDLIEEKVESDNNAVTISSSIEGFSLSDIPDYNGEKAYVKVNNDVPFFSNVEKYNTDAFEIYSDLDSLGRCGTAYANICIELMPTEERGEIGMIKPTGWHTAKYPDIISDKYLYNRCHLIGYQLAGENANEKNLITGTRYLNIDGMLEHENEIADYVKRTGNHVLYRVTPIFKGDNLLASGVLMEGWSVEDEGKGVCFCIYAYNVQPGIGIDYKTGDNWPL